MCTRLLKALAYLTGAIIISVLILFISWAFLKYVDLPYDEIALDVNSSGVSKVYTPTVTAATFTT
jgi:hypothetical protein